MLQIDIPRKRIHRFGESNGQGIAYAHDNIWYFSSERRIYKYALDASPWKAKSKPRRLLTAKLADISLAATRRGMHLRKRSSVGKTGPPRLVPQGPEAFDHIGDISYHNGLIFAPIRQKDARDRNPPWHTLLVLSEKLELIGYSYLQNTSDAWCAVNPTNGLLYLGDRDKPHLLRAFNTEGFFEVFEHGRSSEWPQFLPLVPVPERDIMLKKEDNSPETIHSIQGVCFAPRGELWVARYYTSTYLLGFATEWHNYLRLYDANTGRILQTTAEMDFDGIGDEIEGISLTADGMLCVVVAVNGVGGDKFDVYVFNNQEAVPLMGGDGGIHSGDPVKHRK